MCTSVSSLPLSCLPHQSPHLPPTQTQAQWTNCTYTHLNLITHNTSYMLYIPDHGLVRIKIVA